MQNDAQEGISWGASSQQFSQHLNYYSQGRCSPEISRPSGNRTLPGTSIQGEEDDEGPEKNIYQECYKLCVEEIEAERRRVLNITMLIYGATPDDLPATLRQEVLSLVQVQPLSMEGFMMPAECLRLSIDVFLRTEEDYSSAAQSLLHNLPTRVEAGGAMPWHRFPVQIRIPNRLVSIFDGKIQWWSPPASAPAITAIWPRSAASGRLMIDVSGIPDGEEADILFRVNGEYLKAAIDSVHHLTAGVVHLVAALPEMRFGLCWVEAVQRGQPCKMPSAPVPILLTNNLEAAEEVAFTFDDPEPHSPAVMEDLLQKLASVLHPDIDCIPTVEDCAMLMVKSAIYGWAGMLMALASIGERYHFLVEVVVESDKGDIGLLAFAALSSNLETVDQVSGLLEQCSIPLGLGELRGPLQMSPLHWAALSGNEEIVDLLLSMDSSATSLYESLGGGPQQMTPSQMSAQRHQLLNGEAIELPKPARDAEMPPAWVVEDDTATSPWPPALHAVQQLPGPSRPQPPVRRPSIVWQQAEALLEKLSMPRTLFQVAPIYVPLLLMEVRFGLAAGLAVPGSAVVVLLLLHVLLPMVYRSVYVAGLEIVQCYAHVAGESITSSGRFANQETQQRYERWSAAAGARSRAHLAVWALWPVACPVTWLAWLLWLEPAKSPVVLALHLALLGSVGISMGTLTAIRALAPHAQAAQAQRWTSLAAICLTCVSRSFLRLAHVAGGWQPTQGMPVTEMIMSGALAAAEAELYADCPGIGIPAYAALSGLKTASHSMEVYALLAGRLQPSATLTPSAAAIAALLLPSAIFSAVAMIQERRRMIQFIDEGCKED